MRKITRILVVSEDDMNSAAIRISLERHKFETLGKNFHYAVENSTSIKWDVALFDISKSHAHHQRGLISKFRETHKLENLVTLGAEALPGVDKFLIKYSIINLEKPFCTRMALHVFSIFRTDRNFSV